MVNSEVSLRPAQLAGILEQMLALLGYLGKKMKGLQVFTCVELGFILLIHRKILRQDLMIISNNIYIEFV